MNIGFIGAGRVGVSLGKFFRVHGLSVSGYYSQTAAHAREAADFTASAVFDSTAQLIKQSDAIFLTVPDSAIHTVYAKLPKEALSGKYLVHCSGACSAKEVFPDAEAYGAHPASVHPLFPFSDRFHCFEALSGAFFCIEGEAEGASRFSALLRGIGCCVQRLSDEPGVKARYHAACVIASNFMCALMAESSALLTSCGFSEETARKALAPLMQANLSHLLAVGATDALTGPIERGDLTTIEKHLDALPSEMRPFYCCMSRLLAGLAQNKHPEKDYAALLKKLKEAAMATE